MTSLQVSHALWLSALAVAASSDVAIRRIPNPVVVLVAMLGLTVRWHAAGPGGVAGSALAAAALGAVLLVPFRRRVVGGGDVKLVSAAVCGVAADQLGVFAVATALAGGALSAVLLATDARARSALRASAVASALQVGAPRPGARVPGAMLPYGVAIAVGAGIAAM